MNFLLCELWKRTVIQVWNNMMDLHFWENCPFKSNISLIKLMFRRLHTIQFWRISVSISLLYRFTTALPLHHVIWTRCHEPLNSAVDRNDFLFNMFLWGWSVNRFTASMHMTCTELESIHFYLPVVKITSLFQSLGTVYFIWFCIQRFTAFEPYCVTDLLSLKEWQADITRRTAQTLYCFNSCYTVKRTKMFLLCQVPRW